MARAWRSTMADADPRFAREPDAVDGGRIVMVAGALIATIALSVIASALVTRGLAHHFARPPVASTALPATDGPPLEPDPAATLARFRAEKRALLDGYGWVDRAHGIARIPIDEAMRIVAARATTATPAATAAPRPAGAKR
jgi:hypothetical protein